MAEHVFGRRRSLKAENGYDLHVDKGEQIRIDNFRALPDAPGAAPYHLDLAEILPAEQMQAICAAKKLVFHLNGDTGGIRDGVPQTLVVRGMEADFHQQAQLADNPAFLYILGDCVYLNGEVNEYYNQFYLPYEFYPAPIFAIPGNHDGETLQREQTLKGFMRNFCAPQPIKMPESGESGRTAMVQPYVYWVLRSPVVNIIGLYSNIPDGGAFDSQQIHWLVEQLQQLPRDKPLLLALHHPLYSADEHHSGSSHMKQVLEQAFADAGRLPEMILSGHVHNYQRLSKSLADDEVLPFLITGAGGYPSLHSVKKVDGESTITPVVFDHDDGDTVTLERYCDDHHGFLRLEVTEQTIIGRYYTVPRPHEPFSKQSKLVDYFEFDWQQRKYRPNIL